MNKKELQEKLDRAYKALDRRDLFIEEGGVGKTGHTVYLRDGKQIHIPTSARNEVSRGFMYFYRHTGKMIQGIDVDLIERAVNHW